MAQATEVDIRDLLIAMEQRLEAKLDAKFDAVEAKFDAVETRLDAVEAKFDAVEAKIDGVAADVVELKIAQARIDERFNALEQSIKQRFSALDERFNRLEQSMNQRFQTMGQRFEGVDKHLERFEDRFKTQDGRIWSLVLAMFIAVFGLLAKVSFFPVGGV